MIILVLILVLKRFNKLNNIHLVKYIRIKFENYRKIKLKGQMKKILEEKNNLIEKNCLSVQQLLAEGNFGYVYKGLLNNKNSNTFSYVAVKTLKCGE